MPSDQNRHNSYQLVVLLVLITRQYQDHLQIINVSFHQKILCSGLTKLVTLVCFIMHR